MFEVDTRSRKPIYEQLVERIKELIMKGVLTADGQLPSVRTLATQLSINPNTIQKAYRELETQGFIYSVKGKGSFVQPNSLVQDREKIENLKKELEKLISEALYLGVTAGELMEWIQVQEASKKGSAEND